MAEVGWQAWLTLATLVGVLAVLFGGRVSSDVATLGALALLMVTGVVSPDSALAGFSNKGVLTIGVLFVVAALVRTSGAMEIIGKFVFASKSSMRVSLARLVAPAAFASGFLNNTPVVALLLPSTKRWAEQRGFPATKFFIPLSYAAILGGVCTVIGTSTNLVVIGLMQESGMETIGIFELGYVGLPVAVIGLLYIVTIGIRLLPESTDQQGAFHDPTMFTTEAVVLDSGSLVGTALGDAQVGHLEGLFPVEVRRGTGVIPAPQADLVLRAGDRLILAGQAAEFVRVHRGDDLATVSQHDFDVTTPTDSRRRVIEVVLSDTSHLIGTEVGDGTFRRHYGAAVIAVARSGQTLVAADEWRLRAGDRLLLEAGDGFETHRNSRDFFVVTDLDQLNEQHLSWRAVASLLVVIAMVTVASVGLTSLLIASLAAAVALFAINPTSDHTLREALDIQVLLTIAAAFGIAAAAQETGLAAVFADTVITFGGDSPRMALAATFLATVVMTEMITNNAAAALAFPLAAAIAHSLGVSPTPFAVVVMVGASASFISPIGYQTNLMVYGAGNYTARDFFRIGWPLTVLTAIVTLTLTPIFFPF